jgi:dTMP kinase
MLAKAPGRFVTFEGIEGCGKSTHASRLRDALCADGLPVLLTREPGGTAISEKIREILLDPAHEGMDPRAELLLYLASRAQVVAELLLPALESGTIVLVDRYTDSTVAYQGGGRGLDFEEIRRLNAFAARGLVPDLTFLLDLEPAEGLGRITGVSGSGPDRLERETLEFHRRVREGFLALAEREPDRIVVVRTDRDLGTVSAEIRRIVSERLSL